MWREEVTWFVFLREMVYHAPVTIEITLAGAALALTLALVAGLSRLSRYWIVRAGARVYIEFFRGTSLLVQLFWLFYVLPLFGFFLDPILTGIVALGLNAGAYGAEVVRGAVLSVARGQYEAATALNMSRAQSMRRVILPQAFVAMMPPFGNLFIEILKGSALVSLITITDITFRAQQLNVYTLRSSEIFGIGLNVYFVIALFIIFFMRTMERRLARGLGRVEGAS